MDNPNGNINTMDAMTRLARIANDNQVSPEKVKSSLGARVWRQAIDIQASQDSAGHAVSSLIFLIEKLITTRATKSDIEISDKVSQFIADKFVNSTDNTSACKLQPITDLLDTHTDVMQQRQAIQSSTLIKEWMDATIKELTNIGAYPLNMTKSGTQHAMLCSMPCNVRLGRQTQVSLRPHNNKTKNPVRQVQERPITSSPTMVTSHVPLEQQRVQWS